MKKHIKSIAGVTLLEIMLVLAIASMVIVMSIRYYQNATNSQNANAILEEIQNITAAGDNLAQGTGTYSAVTSSAVANVAGASNMKTPYGSTIGISGAIAGGNSYSVSIPSLPNSVCTQLAAKLKSNTRYTSPTCSGGTVTYTYNSQS